jgi:hypothetical protein
MKYTIACSKKIVHKIEKKIYNNNRMYKINYYLQNETIL